MKRAGALLSGLVAVACQRTTVDRTCSPNPSRAETQKVGTITVSDPQSDSRQFWEWRSRSSISEKRRNNDSSAVRLYLSDASCDNKFLVVRVALRNLSNEWLWIHVPNTIGVAPSLRIEVSDAVGGTDLSQDVKASSPRKIPDYLLLPPGGESSRMMIAVQRFSSAAPGGTWRVVAKYHDSSFELPEPPKDVRWFTAELESNVLEIQVPQVGSPSPCVVLKQ